MPAECEVTYRFVKGQGWVPSTRNTTGRTAEETKDLRWDQLKTGDAVYVYDRYEDKIRIGRVHQRGAPLELEPEDTGSWYHDGGHQPFYIRPFGRISKYPRTDGAWTRLEGVSFPGGKDYEV